MSVTKVESFTDPSVDVGYWHPVTFTAKIYIPLTAIFLAWFTYKGWPFIELVVAPVVIQGILTLIVYFGVIHWLRTEPPSRVFKEETIVVSQTLEDVLRESLEILKKLRARIATVSVEDGQIVARMPMDLWQYGSLVYIKVDEKQLGQTSVIISADSLLPWIPHDGGNTKKVVQRIQKHLLGQ